MDSTSITHVAAQNAEPKKIKPHVISREFVRQYYTVLSRSPQNLHHFYHINATYSHDDIDSENTIPISLEGKTAITAMVDSDGFPYRNCFTRIHSMQTNQTLDDGLLILLSGEISYDGQHPMRAFNQTFVLKAVTELKYFVINDIFRYCDRTGTEITTTCEFSTMDAAMDDTHKNNCVQNGSPPISVSYTGTGAVNSPVAHTVMTNEMSAPSNSLTGPMPPKGQVTKCVPQKAPVEVKVQILARGQTMADLQSKLDKCSVGTTEQLSVSSINNEELANENVQSMDDNSDRLDEATIIDLTMDSNSSTLSDDVLDVDQQSSMIDTNSGNQMYESSMENENNTDETNNNDFVDEAIVVDLSGTFGKSESDSNSSSQNDQSIFNHSDSVLNNRKKSPKKSSTKNQSEAKKSYADHLKIGDKETKLDFLDDTPSALWTSVISGFKSSPTNTTTKAKTDSFTYERSFYASKTRKSSFSKASGSNGNTSTGSYTNSTMNQQQVFIGNISREATEDDLREIFERYGTITRFRLHANMTNPWLRNYAFVTYSTMEAVHECLKHKDSVYFPADSNNKLNINIDTPPSAADKQNRSRSIDMSTKSTTDDKQPTIKNTQLVFTNSASRNLDNNNDNKNSRTGKGTKGKENGNGAPMGRRASLQRIP